MERRSFVRRLWGAIVSSWVGLRSFVRRLWDATVWSRSGVPAEAWRFRGLFRFVFPLTDLFFCYFGVVGYIGGVVSVRAAAGVTFTTWWSALIAVSAAAAFVGVIIPKFWLLELIGKILLIALVAGYVALYLQRALTDFATSASTGLVIILILLPIWRVGDLGFVAWQRGHGGHQ